MKKILILTSVVLLLLLNFERCDDLELDSKKLSSFDLIQQKVLNVSCAIGGCHHSESDLSFAEHRLVLHEGTSYANMVDVDPQNEHAREDNLKIVSPGNPELSLLLHKLHCHEDHEHQHDYGNLMPLGKESLSAGQIDFISKWIEQGAPKDGIIQADTNLLNDNIPHCEEEFIPLAPPDKDKGFQVKVDEFEVAPQFEREIFVYKEVGNEEPIFVNKIEMKMRKNSHHFLVNTFSNSTPANKIPEVNSIRDLRNLDNKYILPTVSQMEFQIPTIASQTPELDYNFPPGVALKMPAHHRLDINLHYVNKSLNVIKGECYVNLYTAEANQVTHEAQSIFLSNETIMLPAHQKTIVIKSFPIVQPMKIFMLTSHTHKLSERFEIQVVGGPLNGKIIYASSNWHHPAIKTFDLPLELTGGESLKMIVTYNNTTDKPVKFGLTSEDEMAIIYGYFY